MIATYFIVLGLTSNLVGLANANEFLKAPADSLGERISEEDIRTTLLDEVEGSLGAGTTAKRLPEIEASLRPIFTALPKNQNGKLDHSGVRYALHRLFVLRHGWALKSLDFNAGASNVSLPAGVLKNQVPAYIEGLFEKRLNGTGFGLHELAVLASTVEHLIHNEAVGRLGAVFNVHQLSLTSAVSEPDAQEVLDTYMAAYILGEDLKTMTLTRARDLHKEMPEIFLAWHDTQKFVDGVRKDVMKTGPERTMNFAALAKIVEVVGEQFGSFQNKECQELKDKLVKVEDRGTGRVKLADFYKPSLDGAWTFQESVGYMRALGLLDESDADKPSVMIANYVLSSANCIARSGFYTVCCKNECENLLGHLEEKIASHEAKPATIADLITNMPSGVGVGPQKLSSSLLQRLEEIAASHAGGMVPLHSRLFAQWMHHVYPRECPYPHMSGTTNSQSPEEYTEESGIEETASQEEMMSHISKSGDAPVRGDQHDIPVEDVMPWSSEEELLVVHSFVAPRASTPAAVRSALLLAAASAVAFSMIQTMKSSLGQSLSASSAQKCFV